MPLGLISGASAGGVVLILGVVLLFRSRFKRKHLDGGFQMQNALWNPDGGGDDADDHVLLEVEVNSINTTSLSVPGGASAASSAQLGAVTLMKSKPSKGQGDKFIATVIRLGQATESAAGLAHLLGFNDMSLVRMIDAYGGGIEAIMYEVNKHGRPEDKTNLQGLLSGTYTNPPDSKGNPPSPEDIAAASKTIEELIDCEEAKIAQLTRAHVLALRLYTTSSYSQINNPLRAEPPQQPHPFAATTYFVSQGIKLMRLVAGSKSDAHLSCAFYRGLKDMTVSDQFFVSGGTEFAPMSTSNDEGVAIDFATSKCPMVLKLETKDFMSRGADISFLSVYPKEAETLFPPLTYLRPIEAVNVNENGVNYLMVRVEPVIP
jgi:hypothetical protein